VTVVTAPVAGTAYKFGLLQNNVGKTLYFAGTTANYPRFFTTTEDLSAATDVYVEEVTGGYRLYFMDGETKTYIDIAVSGTYINAGFTTEPSAVYTMDATYKTLVANVGGTDHYLGTYNDFETIGASKLSFAATSFPANLLQVGTDTPEEPEVMSDREILELAYALESGKTTEESYILAGYITGIKDAWNAQYSNISVVFEVPGCEDLPMLAYRLSGEGAETLAVGDIIIVEGKFTNYNGTIEYAQGCQLLGKMTAAEIVDLIYTMNTESGDMEGVRLTGTVTSIDYAYSEQYGNISVTIAVEGKEDMPVACYRVKGEGIADIKVGDTITVQGTVTYYEAKDSYQFVAGSQVLKIVPAVAEESESVTITFDDKAKLTYSTTLLVWTENGITVTNEKGTYTNDLKDYFAPARFYKGTTLIVEYAEGINEIVFDCNNDSYATALKDAITSGTVSVELDKVTVTFDAPVTSFTVDLTVGQVRMDALTIS